MIRQDAAMPVSRFSALVGIPRRTYTRWLTRARAAAVTPLPPKGPWPAPVVEAVEPLVEKYAQAWPAWGHRKIAALMRVDGHEVSNSTVERAMRRRNLLQPIAYQRERRELAKARKAAFADPATGPNQVWQLDFTEYETTRGGIWRIAGCADYYSKYEFGWHLATTCNATDAEHAVQIAIAEAEQLAGGLPLAEQLCDPATGKITRITLVTDNGGAFKGARFAAFIASRPELLHVRTRRRSPGQNGVRERAFGSLKYEHLYRLEITDGQTLALESERYRRVFNHIRPHEALGLRQPAEIHQQDQQTQHSPREN
ncbi:MAG: transposase [Carbonactinosporaceae bacterium]